MSSELSRKLREGTQKAHTIIEGVGFLSCFLKGVVEKKSYRALLSNFYFLYSLMEEEMQRHCNHPILSKIYFPELHRKESLEQDLSFYYGSNWRQQIRLSPAGEAYIQHIKEISDSQPELLVGFFYARYLGDLSGGQILKRIAQKAMNLTEEGLAFYEFKTISDINSFKSHYRRCLDEILVDDATANQIVDAANEAFNLNMKLYEELEGNLIKAIGQVLFNSLTRRWYSSRPELATPE